MPRGLTQPTKDLIAAAAILAEIQPTTVRGVAYQFFNRKMVPDMSRASVKRVSRLLTLARERGDIPWEWIVDETRPVELRNSWKDPDRYMRAVGRGYRKDRWDDQPRQVMVVSEKSTVGGVIRPITDKYGVPFQVLHGWGSSTALHDLAERSAAADRLLVVLYVGDHDPSGRYMSDVDLEKRTDKYGGCVYVERVAVDEDHILEYGLPTFPASAKTDDSRHPWFVKEHGETCCELDALSPNTLRAMLEDAILAYIDQERWDRAEVVEAAIKTSIGDFLKTWPGVAPA